MPRKQQAPKERLQLPNSFAVPDAIVDRWLPHLSGAEVKVLLYVCRRTLGFYQRQDTISYSQFIDGIKKHDGTYLDHGAGVSRGALYGALRGLEEKGLIVAERRCTTKGDRDTTNYAINWDAEPRSENEPLNGVVKLNDRRSENGRRVVQKLNEQDTVLQDTEEQESRVVLYLFALLNACKPDERTEVRAHLAELGNGERVGRAIGRAEMEWDKRQGPRGFWRRVEWWMENGG